MKTLEEYNKERFLFVTQEMPPVKSGIECPKCRRELVMESGYVLYSDPPRRPVKCEKCDYHGSVY